MDGFNDPENILRKIRRQSDIDELLEKEKEEDKNLKGDLDKNGKSGTDNK